MIKEKCVPIPIINSDKPLKTGKVEDNDIQGYIMLDRETLGKDANDNLVAVRHIPAVPFPLIIINLDDKELTEGKLYAIEKNGIKLRKAYQSGKGIVFQSMWNSEKPMAIFGKQKDFIKVLGRVILGWMHFEEKPA